MSFFLTDEQEDAVNLFLDEENRKVCEDQLNTDLPDELKEIIQKTIEADSPIPAFDPAVGYYSISFTPTDKGNRIYVHHHISNRSVAISDPLLEDQIKINQEESENAEVEVVDESVTFVDDRLIEENNLDPALIDLNGPPDVNMSDIVQHFGSPPQELLDKMGVNSAEDLIQMEKETVENQ